MKTIKLTQDKIAIVDNEDFESVSTCRWHAVCYRGYAYAERWTRENRSAKTELLHHFVLHVPSSQLIDHINGNGLDCRKSNLRVCTKSQNAMNRGKQANNTSGYKGVSWARHFGQWRAQIWVGRKNIFLGYFLDKLDAARAYNEAAILHHGDFAHLNSLALDKKGEG